MRIYNKEMKTVDEYFESEVGQQLLRKEEALVKPFLETLLGSRIVQVGGAGGGRWLEWSRIEEKYFLAAEGSGLVTQNLQTQRLIDEVRCHYQELPLLPNCVDVMVLPHVLESVSLPKALLGEIYTALKPHGYLLIVGCNAWSPGLLLQWLGSSALSWLKHWLPAFRLKNWLRQHRYTVVRQVKRSKSYVLLVQKQVSCVPLNLAPGWTKTKVMAKGIAEPTTRNPL